MSTQVQSNSDRLFELRTRAHEGKLFSRQRAVELAKQASRKRRRSIQVASTDGRIEMSFQDGGLYSYMTNDRRRRRK
ncbi:MAG: hypothetical protein VX899_10695 [Myxococcota bacterium]|nr:hypothetical protein [Myxococcota bacterium]